MYHKKALSRLVKKLQSNVANTGYPLSIEYAGVSDSGMRDIFNVKLSTGMNRTYTVLKSDVANEIDTV